MRRRDHLGDRVPKQHRITVGSQNTYHDLRLIGDYGIAFHRQKMPKIRIGFIDNQYIVAMHLPHCQQTGRRNIKGPAQRGTVALDVVERILGIETQIQRMKRRTADPAVTGAETGTKREILRPFRLQEIDFILPHHFHRTTPPKAQFFLLHFICRNDG